MLIAPDHSSAEGGDSVRPGRTALVTGGAGFLGRHLCKRLLADGYRVVAFDNLYTGSRRNFAEFADDPGFSFIEGDVRELDSALPQSAVDGLSEIYNLACPASPIHYQADPVATSTTSVYGVINCLELARRHSARLLHASTSEIYGDPEVHPQPESYWGNVNTVGIRSCYDEGKRVAETLVADYIRQFRVDARMVRIFNTYGPFMHPNDGRVVSNFIVQALKGDPVTVYGDGSQTRSFQYCDDLIEAMRRFMSKGREQVDAFFGKEGRPPVPVLNTGNPGEFTMLELADEVIRQVGSGSSVIYRPLPADDPRKRKPDITLARAFLGWEPKVPLAQGIAATIAYFKTVLSGCS